MAKIIIRNRRFYEVKEDGSQEQICFRSEYIKNPFQRDVSFKQYLAQR
jgi:hypothetical protein